MVFLFERTGEVEFLHDGVVACREAVGHEIPGTTSRSMASYHLAGVLFELFQHVGDGEALSEARRWTIDALTTAPLGPHDRALILAKDAAIEISAALQAGDPAPLAAAESSLVEAVTLVPTGHVMRPVYLNDLGNLEYRRYLLSGDRKLLDRAEERIHEAIATTPATDANAAGVWIGLGTVLSERFRIDGGMTPLRHAIDAYRRAVDGLVPADPFRPAALAMLGGALTTLSQQVDDPAESATALDDAIAALDEAAAASEPDTPRSAVIRNNHASALHRRYETSGNTADLDRAEALYRGVLSMAQITPELRRNAATNLALVLTASPDSLEQIDEAEALLREALALPGAPDIGNTKAAINLAVILAERWRRTGEEGVRRQAILWSRQSVESGTTPMAERIRCAVTIANLAAEVGDWATAARWYAKAVRWYPHLAASANLTEDRERELSRFAALATDAAACALNHRDPDLALGLLEEGRAVLLSRTLQTRGTISRLQVAAPELADRLACLDALLASDGATPIPEVADLSAMVDRPARRRILTEQRDAVIEEIRKLDGFADFLRPVRVANLVKRLSGSTVIVLNASRYRSDALVVGNGQIDVVPLTGLDAKELASRTSSYVQALSHIADSATAFAERVAAPVTVSDTLTWLWHTTAGPVLDFLGHETTPADAEWPRVWWCPTGLFTFLPMHAAGCYSESAGAEEGGHTTIDRVVSSYTPTLSVLADALERPPHVGTCTPFVVALPDTPGYSPLPQVVNEVSAIVAENQGTIPVVGQSARRDTILKGLIRHRRFHYAGHGMQNPTRSRSAMLLPYDHQTAGPLTMTDVACLDLHNAELAFLNACETAVGEINLADETQHMAGALQTAGFTHVVAAAWSIDDKIGALTAGAFYRHLRENDPATALHRALREARAWATHQNRPHRRALIPFLWAALRHVGP